MRKGCWGAGCVMAILTLVAADQVFHTFWDFGAASDELAKAIQDYRAEGLPWTSSEIFETVLESENAAALLRKAIEVWPKSKGSRGFYDPNLSKAEMDGTLAKLLPQYEASLSLAHLAAQKTKLDFSWNLDQGFLLETPETSGVKALVRMLGQRAVIRANEGDDTGALQDLTDARQLVVLVGQLPTLHPVFVSSSCRIHLMASTRECLARAAGQSSRLLRYRNWLADDSPLLDLHRAFKQEIYLPVTSVRSFDLFEVGRGFLPQTDILPFVDGPEMLGNSGHPFPTLRSDGVPMNVRSRAYMTRCLQEWTELSRRTHGLKDDFAVIAKFAGEIQDRDYAKRGMSYGFVAILLPSFSSLAHVNQRSMAEKGAALALADSLIHHAHTKKWPTSTSIPDPFGKGSLQCRFDGKRFRVWSVGPNGIDERGTTSGELALSSNPKDFNRRVDDLVAVYPPIQKSR